MGGALLGPAHPPAGMQGTGTLLWGTLNTLLPISADILREFNPSLKGFSVGTGKESSPGAFLNQAVAGNVAG